MKACGNNANENCKDDEEDGESDPDPNWECDYTGEDDPAEEGKRNPHQRGVIGELFLQTIRWGGICRLHFVFHHSIKQ